jgi:hypothetical protein
MSATKVPYGRSVKLLVDLQGYPDGRLVEFAIYRKTNLGEEKIAEVNGVTKGNKAMAFWNPDFLGSTTLELEENPTTEKVEEKYYYIAKIDDQETKSADFEFTFPFTLYLKDGEDPLDGVEFKITLSDESVRDGSFSKGFAEFYDAPLGAFKVEIDGYSPGILYGVLKR